MQRTFVVLLAIAGLILSGCGGSAPPLEADAGQDFSAAVSTH